MPSQDWVFQRLAPAPSRARRAATGALEAARPDVLPDFFLSAAGLSVVETIEVRPTASGLRRRAVLPALEHGVELAPGEAALLAVRHPSGALTFHPAGIEGGRRSRRGTSRRTLRVPLAVPLTAARRGPVGEALRFVVVKLARAAAERAVSWGVERLARAAEQRIWKRKGLKEGWFRVVASPAGLKLVAEAPPVGQRSLIFIHGTFSNAAATYASLAGTGFFAAVRERYEDRVFAFDHFTVSRSPEENARMLLQGLGPGARQADVVTHSRGGLVLRNLVERAAQLPDAARLAVERAVLVASPNDGTPLASPARWRDAFGWLANLLELFPANPWTTGAAFVSEALVWLAARITGDLPGLHAMDRNGAALRALQAPPGPPAGCYSALVANFHATGSVLARLADTGVDQFFSGANDLVVPSEGGWRIDGGQEVPAQRVGCFGAGGNLAPHEPDAVHHVSFFGRAETATFLARALAGEPQGLPSLDTSRPLPDRRFVRGAESLAAADHAPRTALPGGARGAHDRREAVQRRDRFQLWLIDGETPRADGSRAIAPSHARIVASWGGARVVEALALRADAGPHRTKTEFGRLIAFHERVKAYTDRSRDSLPAEGELLEFGQLLFDTLFRGGVRRLYDEARARESGRGLAIVFASDIPWLAEKPWEFAYDGSRRSFLATEDVAFVRSVFTAVPAEPAGAEAGPLRMLVASAHPLGTGELSIDDEVEVIRRGFTELEQAGLARIEVVPRATPAALHGHLATGRYDVLHFIGHAQYEEETGPRLLFEDDSGRPYPLDERSAREIFCRRGLRLVFLNACQTGAASPADFNRGLAQSLVAHGVPALVANQYSVLDRSATTFAQHFYWSLARGLTLGESAREARIGVNYSLGGEAIDWAVPVVYAHDPDQRLREAEAALSAPRVAAPSRAGRRATSDAVRVGVWDVDGAVSGLAPALECLNAAQRVFDLTTADVGAPLDALAFDGGERYLSAERVAARLGVRVAQLGLDLLVCVTSLPLRDAETLNLYAWWPDVATPGLPRHGGGIGSSRPTASAAVAMLSHSGLEALRGDPVALTNSLVTVLAGYFGALGTHARRPRTCPSYFNPERDPSLLRARQRFDRTCAARLTRILGRDATRALDALLSAFTRSSGGNS